MTDAPCSAASMEAGSPEAPAPTTTTSATLSQCRATLAAWALSALMPVRALAPSPANAALTKSLRGRFVLVSFFFMLRSCIFDRLAVFVGQASACVTFRSAPQKSKPNRLKPVLLAPRHERIATNLGDRGRTGLRHGDLQLAPQNLDHGFNAFLPE